MECVHRWILGAPNGTGPTPGTCEKCGATRVFTGGVPSWCREYERIPKKHIRKEYLKATVIT